MTDYGLVRPNILRRVHRAERELALALERSARVRERGAVDVREDRELEAVRGEARERRGRVWEDRPVGERRRERRGGRRCG